MLTIVRLFVLNHFFRKDLKRRIWINPCRLCQLFKVFHVFGKIVFRVEVTYGLFSLTKFIRNDTFQCCSDLLRSSVNHEFVHRFNDRKNFINRQTSLNCLDKSLLDQLQNFVPLDNLRIHKVGYLPV